jgi:hypothetical protein
VIVLLAWMCAALAEAPPATTNPLVDDVIRQVARERGAAPPGTAVTATPASTASTPPAALPTRPDAKPNAATTGDAAPSVPLAGDRATGATLCVHDPQGLATEAILVDADGFTGPMQPRDDGVLPDVRARDGVHSVTLAGWSGGPVKVRIRSGTRTWDEEARVAGNNQLWVSLTMMPGAGPLPDGDVVAPPGGDPKAPKHVPNARPDGATPATRPSPAGSGACADASDDAYLAAFHTSFFAWMTAGAGLFLGLGLVLGRHARASRTPEATDARPQRLDDDDALRAWIATNGTRRWVVLGPVPEGLDAAWHVPAGTLPEEVYDSTAALALGGGAPVAVLITDVMTLDAPDEGQPEDVLALLLAGRCPLLQLAPRR